MLKVLKEIEKFRGERIERHCRQTEIKKRIITNRIIDNGFDPNTLGASNLYISNKMHSSHSPPN